MPAHAPPARPYKLAKGLDLILDGYPEQVVHETVGVSSVALIADDYVGLRLELVVEGGERVRLGQPLLRSRERPELVLTSPGAGTVKEIERGRRRTVRSVVVELDEEDESGFQAGSHGELSGLQPEEVRESLLKSGLWAALRARPFGRVADPRARPHSLFVTAMDTNPLAADPETVLVASAQDFRDGLQVLAQLFDGSIFLCKRAGSEIPVGDSSRVTVAEFGGQHPAGLPGTHMHFLDPVGRGKTNWYVGYQDVVAFGRLFTTGQLAVERVVALAGPQVMQPRLVRTRLGASIDDLVRGELAKGPCRVISGSILSGRQASSWGRHVGRYHLAVSALAGDNAALSGHPGPMIPVESFEGVMPLDLLPAPLLRALVIGDVEAAESLGCLELEEEDLALCAYVCPGKLDYGAHLRAVLDEIAREG